MCYGLLQKWACALHSLLTSEVASTSVLLKGNILHLGKAPWLFQYEKHQGRSSGGKKKKEEKNPQKSKPNPRTVSSQLANSHTETRHSLVFKEPILGPAARDENFIPDHRHPKFLLMGLVLNSSKETSFPFLLLSPPISFFTLPSPSEPDGNSSFSIWWTTLPHRKEEVALSEEVEAESAPLVNTKAACLATNGQTSKKYLVKPLKQTRNICKDSYNVVLLLPLPHFRSCMLIHSIYIERGCIFIFKIKRRFKAQVTF